MYVLAALTFTAEGNACSGRLSAVGKEMLYVSGTLFAHPCVCTMICSSFIQRKELLLPSQLRRESLQGEPGLRACCSQPGGDFYLALKGEEKLHANATTLSWSEALSNEVVPH